MGTAESAEMAGTAPGLGANMGRVFGAGHSRDRRRRCHREAPLSQAGHIVRPGGAQKDVVHPVSRPFACCSGGKFKTRHDVQKRLNEVLGELDKGTYTRRSSVTFEKFAEDCGKPGTVFRSPATVQVSSIPTFVNDSMSSN